MFETLLKRLREADIEKPKCKICGAPSYVSKDGDIRLTCKHGKEGLEKPETRAEYRKHVEGDDKTGAPVQTA